MSFNTDLADALDRLGELLELTGANRFRVNAHQKAARTIRDHAADLRPIADDEGALTAIDGIGKGIASKVGEFAASATLAEIDELLNEVPEGLPPLLGLGGVGPKTLGVLWREGGITGEATLRQAIEDGTILELPRMGQKTVDNIARALDELHSGNDRLQAGIARPIADSLVELMRGVGGVERAAFAGSLRRGREDVGDLDILVATRDAPAARDVFCEMPSVERVLARGDAKCSVRLSLSAFGVKSNRWGLDADRALQVDLRMVDPDRWGAAIMYFTGSKAHNVRLRERAIARGLRLNEYGLFPSDDNDTPPQQRGVEPVAAETEEQIYTALGLGFIPPTMREDRGEIALVEDEQAPPRLIEVGDVRADLHTHTTASDGSMSILESAKLAEARGFHTLAITDHSQSSTVAGGLKPDRLRAQIDEVRAANNDIDGIELLIGSEVDILADGRLDYDDELLARLDVVVASPHAALKQKPGKATKRLLRAIEHPLVHIIGHPTGRLVLRRGGLEPAMDELIGAAVEHNVALEINAHWMRLDLRDTHVRAAVDAGALIAIDCDVHQPGDYDNLEFGVLTAQRGWLTPDRCINCWDADRLHAWLRAKR